MIVDEITLELLTAAIGIIAAASVIWLVIRFINRREKWVIQLLIGILLLFGAFFAMISLINVLIITHFD